jgi:hypothetical protein
LFLLCSIQDFCPTARKMRSGKGENCVSREYQPEGGGMMQCAKTKITPMWRSAFRLQDIEKHEMQASKS